jgi:hypothetical protein
MKTKICQFCNKEYELKPHERNSKFCSATCRNKNVYYNKGGKEWQEKYRAKQQKQQYNKDNAVKCEVCGRYFKQVGTHVVQAHGYKTAREYREDYGFDVKRGQLPKDYRQLKHDYVFENGTVENLKEGERFRFKKGQDGLGLYKRSRQTLKRLKENSSKFWGKGRVDKKSNK